MSYDAEDVSRAPLLGPARERYSDWLGTVALDDPHDSSSDLDPLYALAGLSPDEWAIIGVSMAGGRIGVGDLSSAASVYAVSRDLVARFEDFPEVAARYDGRIPVIQVSLDVEQAGLRLLEDVFKRWTIHIVVGGIAKDYDLAIIETRDAEA